MVKSEGLGKEIAQEGRHLLERMPRLQASRDLRKEYQKLVDGNLPFDQFKSSRTRILGTTRLELSVARTYASKMLEAVRKIDDEFVKEVNRGELVSWGVRGLYRWIDETIPEAIADRLDKVKTMSDPELTDLLQDVRLGLGKREDLDRHKDIDISLQRMLVRLDPYSSYTDPEAKARADADRLGKFTGVGVIVRKDHATDMLRVVTPIRGSPAHVARVLTGDLISTITREVDSEGNLLAQPEILLTRDLTMPEAVKKIVGKSGTKVKLTIEREGVAQPFDVEIQRDKIETESVFGVKRNADDSWDCWLDRRNKLGYVRLSHFSANTADDLTKMVQDLRGQGMRGLVLDLRFNPGGLLNSGTRVADLFIDD